LAGTATALGIVTVNDRDRFYASGSTDRGAHDAAVTARTLTNVAWGSAAVTGVVGIILLLASRSTGAPPRVDVAR
jgi:hypothetical protein